MSKPEPPAKRTRKPRGRKKPSNGPRTPRAAKAASVRDVDSKPLTGKQAAFVRWYTTPGETLFNGTRAAERAGYHGDPNTLAQVGHENLRKPNIARAVQAELRRQYSASDLTIERVLRDVELVRQLAIRDGRYQAALRASQLHGHYLKMWTQKIEHLHTIEDASTEELFALLAALVKQIDGLDLARLLAGDGPAAGGVPDPAGAATTH